MTISECYNQIAACNDTIYYYNAQIRELEDKIELYESMHSRLGNSESNMAEFCSGHKNRICSTKTLFPRVKYIDGYIEDMTEYLQGEKYGKVIDNFENARTVLKIKIQNALSKIEGLKDDIHHQENRISQLMSEIREIERIEEEERYRENIKAVCMN